MEKNNQHPSIQKARKKAEHIIDEQEELSGVLKNASEKARQQRSRIQSIWKEIELLIGMIRAYSNGDYRNLPWKAIVMAVAAVIYFVNPFDIIPDFLTGLGFIDDAAVVGFVVNAIKEELDKYEDFIFSKRQSANAEEANIVSDQEPPEEQTQSN